MLYKANPKPCQAEELPQVKDQPGTHNETLQKEIKKDRKKGRREGGQPTYNVSCLLFISLINNQV